jgi:dinuclear metal center YbgI/SA1388 family protein
MKARVKDVIRVMDELAPHSMSQEWDNSGLQIGHPEWPVREILVALDPLAEVVEFACANHADMLVTHHPLIFKPLRSIHVGTPAGKVIQTALAHELAVFSAHTNLDVAENGANDILARKLGLKEIEPLMSMDGKASFNHGEFRLSFGRAGTPDEALSLGRFAETVKRRLGLESIRVSGPQDLKISRVATCCGSGSGMMELFLSSGAQVFISGDLKYHDARDAEALGLALIDIGHFASEHLMIHGLAKALGDALANKGFEVEVNVCGLEKEPFRSC